MGKNVALVLGSGGARGLAHIGAIEALEERGYTISSIAGCSMGSIIAGMYAAGQLVEAKTWFLSQELEKVVPDRPLEELNIPCTLVASDMMNTEEVVFRTGSLFEAVRASISIPLFFKPVQIDNRLLIDGGVLNPLPLHIVERTEGDILVAMDMGPLGEMLEPMGSLSFEDAYDAYRTLVLAGAKAGADLVVIETMTDIYEVRAAVLAVWTA